MTKVRMGRGAVLVEEPPRELLEGIRRFVRRSTGGEYENLYTLSDDGKVLVTLPGYANRVKRLCLNARVLDERMSMPEPALDFDTGCKAWNDAICKAICACGGIVSVPDILGFAKTAAAILKAFPREALLERGTPLSVVATESSYDAKSVACALEELLPGREIGVATSGRCSDSEDIIVAQYDAMVDVQIQYAGALVGEVPTESVPARARSISAVRSAARWGVSCTSFGGQADVDIAVEGLFGPLVSWATYDDAVKAGFGMPITVVWLPCPKPRMMLGSAPLKVLEDMAMTRNDAFVAILADILRRVPGDTGCVLCTEHKFTAERVKALLPGVVEIGKGTPAKERKAVLGDIAGGTIRKAIVSSGCFPRSISHGVMVVANCKGGDMSGWSIPWRHLTRPGGKTWLVDFRHDWDRNNGRPGRLALNDEARMRRYREMGFAQMTVEGAAQLPF